MANNDAINGLKIFPLADGLTSRLIDHDGPSSYTTGGETINASALGFKNVVAVFSMASKAGSRTTQAYIGSKGIATSFKLVWITRTNGAEIGNGTDLSADSCKLLVIGMGS